MPSEEHEEDRREDLIPVEDVPVFLGVDYSFNDTIQAVHRIYRFQQTRPVQVHFVYADSEAEIVTTLKTKWAQHARPGPASVMEAKFHAGTRVRHATWGEGIILDSKIQDEDEIVDVVFEAVGVKRLAASLANLTIIK